MEKSTREILKEQGIELLPDGSMRKINREPKPSLYGDYVIHGGDFTSENIEKAKEVVLDKICSLMREIAKRKPEFFIIKNFEQLGVGKGFSVGCKFILPTVLDDEESL